MRRRRWGSRGRRRRRRRRRGMRVWWKLSRRAISCDGTHLPCQALYRRTTSCTKSCYTLSCAAMRQFLSLWAVQWKLKRSKEKEFCLSPSPLFASLKMNRNTMLYFDPALSCAGVPCFLCRPYYPAEKSHNSVIGGGEVSLAHSLTNLLHTPPSHTFPTQQHLQVKSSPPNPSLPHSLSVSYKLRYHLASPHDSMQWINVQLRSYNISKV